LVTKFSNSLEPTRLEGRAGTVNPVTASPVRAARRVATFWRMALPGVLDAVGRKRRGGGSSSRAEIGRRPAPAASVCSASCFAAGSLS
jgi:hypothetical protein